MADRIELSELETYLYHSADILRTHVDASDYKMYVFPLLFFKRICDVYDEETGKKKAELGDAFFFYPEKTIHRFSIPEGCHWRDVRNTTENIGVAIVDAFRGIEDANGSALQGVFGHAAWTNKTRLPDETLKNLIEHFSSKTLTLDNCPEDELGQAYEYLIKKFGDDSGHTSQEFYTNRTVVHLMTEMLKPQPGETIYDPTCGSAGMLISCIAYLKEKGLEWRNVKCYGQEINELSSSIGKMNLFLHGVEYFEVVNDDTLKRPAFVDHGELRQFDLCLANPPYSISTWNRDAFEHDPYGRNFLGTPPQGRADYAFFQHILKSLNPKTGRCAILFPHGVLFRGEEAEMRQKLVQSDLVECVIGIGKNLFYNSPMEACIVICRANKPIEHRGKVLFINARHLVTRKNAQSYLEDSHIQEISDTYGHFAAIEGFSAIASTDEIMANNGKLSIALYVRGSGAVKVSPEQLDEVTRQWAENRSVLWGELDAINLLLKRGDENGSL